MLFTSWKSQAARAVGAILLAGQATQAIDLDLTNSGETLIFHTGIIDEGLFADMRLYYRFNQIRGIVGCL